MGGDNKGDDEYEGKVNGLMTKSETTPNGRSRMIWTFRILRFDEKLGSPLPKIPVEMKGLSFEGFINDEDTVRVKGKWKEGKVLEITKLFNVTNNIDVEAHKWH
jgi:hypothetical protein